MANATGIYETKCVSCSEDIQVILADNEVHVTFPDQFYDVLLGQQQTKVVPIKRQAWDLYTAARNLFAAWMEAHPKAPLDDKEGIRLGKQITAARNAWLACGGKEEVVIG